MSGIQNTTQTAPEATPLDGARRQSDALRTPAPVEGAGGDSTVSFSDVMTRALEGADASAKSANDASVKFTQGGGSVHEVLIAQERASISLRYAVTLKNRALEAYRDLMNTQI